MQHLAWKGMEMSTKELIVTTTIPEDYWEDVKIIAVDIETDTEDPLGKKEGLGGKANAGSFANRAGIDRYIHYPAVEDRS